MKTYRVENFDHFGRGIVKLNNVPVFIKNCIPNEEITFKIIRDKKKYMEGELLEIAVESIDRIVPSCPYYSKCGGCDLLHLNYSRQLKFKENKVKEIIHKFCGDIDIKPIVYDEHTNFYRNKITLHVDDEIGLYSPKSQNIVPIEHCGLVMNKINDAINIIRNSKEFKNIYKAFCEIVLKQVNDDVIAVFYLREYKNVNLNQLTNLFPQFKNITVIKESEILTQGQESIQNIGELKYLITADGFFQINNYITKKLYDKILELAMVNKDDKVLDLYCGSGTIGLYLANQVKEVLGLEINQTSINNANYNKKINNIENAKFICNKASSIINNDQFKPSIIIVDPPRAGLDQITLDYINQTAARKVIYVSCDPVTLARDLNQLKTVYDIQLIVPFDMFPNTYHVESLAVLSIKNKENIGEYND